MMAREPSQLDGIDLAQEGGCLASAPRMEDLALAGRKYLACFSVVPLFEQTRPSLWGYKEVASQHKAKILRLVSPSAETLNAFNLLGIPAQCILSHADTEEPVQTAANSPGLELEARTPRLCSI